MTDSSLARKKKKVTYTASIPGIEKAENALKRLGFESKSNFRESSELYLSRSTVTKFFQRQPIQLDSFKRICEKLTLNWKDIVEIIEEGKSERLEINNYSSPDTDEVVEVQAVHRQVTVIDKQSKKIKAVITLEGDINSVNNDLSLTIELFLRTYSGDTIKITDIQKGSIRLIVEGSQEDIERLVSRIQSGELKELSGFPVEDIQVLNESSDDEESNELNNKWHLVQEIVNHAVVGRNLIGADLSDADLSGADLSDANLSDADLSDAYLSDAYLSGANLSGANLSGADLSGANLSGAILRNTNLRNTNLRDTKLRRADFSGAIIDYSTKFDDKLRLIWEIVTHGAVGRNLRDANLSRANLKSTNLRNADLSGANLSDADLSDADLRNADLSGANLSGANLIHANLIHTNLSHANLKNARFGNNQGISEPIKRDIIQKGVIFEDSPADSSRILLPD